MASIKFVVSQKKSCIVLIVLSYMLHNGSVVSILDFFLTTNLVEDQPSKELSNDVTFPSIMWIFEQIYVKFSLNLNTLLVLTTMKF